MFLMVPSNVRYLFLNQQKFNFMKMLNPLNSPKLDIHVLVIGTVIVIFVAIGNAILN